MGQFCGRQRYRDLFWAILKAIGIPPNGVRQWKAGRNDGRVDFALGSFGGNEYQIWFSYTFNFILELPEPNSGDERWTTPKTWGEFVSERKEGSRDDDPRYTNGSRTPDIVFFSACYNSTN